MPRIARGAERTTARESIGIETKFLRLNRPAVLSERIDGWRVCWLGGWDRDGVLFVVMVKRQIQAGSQLPCNAGDEE
ncbi:MAG TPA: hypothetical protein VHW45_00705 [Candidatus Sulfotelmatobacter sp.]|nr:hypothetical protein [Candidatus Sulfotelmatobacter sp.]